MMPCSALVPPSKRELLFQKMFKLPEMKLCVWFMLKLLLPFWLSQGPSLGLIFLFTSLPIYFLNYPHIFYHLLLENSEMNLSKSPSWAHHAFPTFAGHLYFYDSESAWTHHIQNRTHFMSLPIHRSLLCDYPQHSDHLTFAIMSELCLFHATLSVIGFQNSTNAEQRDTCSGVR